jgi:hypothetical protein
LIPAKFSRRSIFSITVSVSKNGPSIRAYPNHFSLGSNDGSYSILPDCGDTIHHIRDRSVVFPTPDGPVMRQIPQGTISKERFSNTRRPL